MKPKLHVALNVNNLAESLAFYKAFWGAEPVKVRTGYAKFDLDEPGVNLTLNERPVKEAGGLNHLGIQVGSTDDVLATKLRWKAAGLLTEDEMQTNCCYAIQDKVWATDPNGYRWEVFVVLKDQLPETATNTQATACCAPLAQPVQLSGLAQGAVQ
ncbi:MAG: VOC family protein [Acidobacteria bacterium]|nr:VOC family protein [Acidobacteriota bacterium]MBI3422817.1 VOC family protein [Acidobacteriota bacterium]